MKILVRLGILCSLMLASFSVLAQDDRLQVVATYSILGDVVQNVAGDVADVTTTMPAGADPHSFEPVPSDITALADADVVFINGGFFEEGLLEAIENADTDMNIVTVSNCVPVLAFDGHSDEHDHDEEHSDEHDHDEEHSDEDHSDEHDHDEEHSDEDHSDEHDHDEEHSDEDHSDEHDHDEDHHAVEELCDEHTAELSLETMTGDTMGALYASECEAGHGHSEEEHEDDDHEEEEHEDDDHEEEEHEEGDHDHDHGSCDPHVWMNVDNVMFWTLMIRDTLSELDPANADTYATNADAYLQELTALKDELQTLVDTVPQENRVLITNHDSFGYFAAGYDFEIVTTIIASGSTLAEPSAADIADVIDLVRDEGVPAIFAENTVSTAIAEIIASETGAELFVLYSGSLSTADEPASTYLDYMRYNVSTIATALAG